MMQAGQGKVTARRCRVRSSSSHPHGRQIAATPTHPSKSIPVPVAPPRPIPITASPPEPPPPPILRCAPAADCTPAPLSLHPRH
ncbi:hypothetical protein GQ55_2G311800 [Panicum hallii var. hallii]|uniref:Uncharacterized protein n=1 Tax=Panicum hallii var. hallii TaxID=1504633 RepID=A0A2T7EUC9_9POAL|nr:hypothetical protein GQ55_2G311800 [Panicum hallii var. hallii]